MKDRTYTMQRTNMDDRYDLSELLGAGGMAEVYLAHDRMLGRDVALKILREQYADDEELVERFRREARSAASLSHPNIVPVYDRGESKEDESEEDLGAHYIAMEYVPGGTLKEYMKSKGPLEPGKAFAVAAQVASALEAAHEQGVVHRDIKPQNVLVTETGDVKVADFGIARAASGLEASQEISHTSQVMGTANYMAPEQALGEDVMPQSDLYSLGVTLYEMLTGEVPFTGESPVNVSMRHVDEPPRSPAGADPDIPETMSALVMKLLSKDPADRYGSAAETGDALRRLGDGLPAATELDEEGVTGAEDSPGQVSDNSPPPPAVPVRTFRARAARSRPRKVIPLLVALTLLGAVLSLGLVWDPGEGGVIGSLEGVPGAGAIGEARGALGEAGQASLGPEEAEIPDVEGLTEEEARERLDAAGFGAETRSRASSEEDAGRVLEQSVPGGREAQEGSRVLLAVGSGPQVAQQIAVPDLAGLGYAEATDTLREAGLASGGRYETPSASVPVGSIVEQGIPAGETVKPGTAVNLTVSSGPANTGSTSASGQSAPAQGSAQQDSAPGNPSQNAEGNGVGGGSGAEGSNSPWSASYGDDVEEESTDTGESTASPPDAGEQDAPAPAAPARRSSASAPATQDPSYPEEPPSSPIPYQAPQEASPPAGGGSAEAGGAPPPQGTEPEGEKAPTIAPPIKPVEKLAPTAPDTPPPPEPTQTPTLGEDQYGR